MQPAVELMLELARPIVLPACTPGFLTGWLRVPATEPEVRAGRAGSDRNYTAGCNDRVPHAVMDVFSFTCGGEHQMFPDLVILWLN